jgi:hypothetical protein
MQIVTLYIETYGGEKTVRLDEEVTIGRTDAAQIVLGDTGLSRLNTTFFRTKIWCSSLTKIRRTELSSTASAWQDNRARYSAATR